MVVLSEAALMARLVRVAASVLEAPLAALFRFDGDKANLVERVVRLEQPSEVTQMTLPAARLRLEARRTWHAAQRTRPPTELVAFPSSTRVAWAMSTPLFDAKKNQLGLLVVADMRARAEDEVRLAGLDDVCVLLEDKLAGRPSSDRPTHRQDEPTGRVRTYGAPTLVHAGPPAQRVGHGSREESSSVGASPSTW